MRILTSLTTPLCYSRSIARSDKSSLLLLAAAVLTILAAKTIFVHYLSAPPPTIPLIVTLITGKRYYLVQFKRVSVKVNDKKLPGYAISYREL